MLITTKFLGLQLGLQLSMQLVFNWYATDNRKSAPGHLELESGFPPNKSL